MAALTEAEKAGLAGLVTLGYIEKRSNTGVLDAATSRAIKRFQRHAARSYRLPQDTPDIFHGRGSGVLDAGTLAEIQKWLANGWKLPLGRFPLVALSQGGRLRSDAAAAWAKVTTTVTAAGGTVEGPYGDTTRTITFKAGVGASRHSFHYAGRALDLQQALAGGRGQRYYVAKDPVGDVMFWRIHCKVDAGKGVEYKAKEKKYFDFFSQKDFDIPAGRYIDLTSTIEADGTFERIRAQKGWEANPKKAEWWHFQYAVDKQATILDELELIGFSEAALLKAGWSVNDLDHAPG